MTAPHRPEAPAPDEGVPADIRWDQPVPDRDEALGMLHEMLRIRRFEEKSAELYAAQKIHGFLHLYIGQEAIAVGAVGALEPEDAVVATYREHGHALVRGLSAGSVMAEMYGKQEGCSRGRGGSMHLFDAATRFYGGNAIVGGGLPMAVGLALADKLSGRKRVTACFFGEGAVAEGEFHESLNLAALWQLPVLFCCENNLYAMGTALGRSESEVDVSLKAASYEVPAWPVDGMDVLKVRDATRRAVSAVREGGGPYFLEFLTYRFRPHSMFDPELYREKHEVEAWKRRDPIPGFVDRMTAAGVLTEDDLASMEAKVAEEVEEAVRFAEEGTLEPVSELTRFVMSDPPALREESPAHSVDEGDRGPAAPLAAGEAVSPAQAPGGGVRTTTYREAVGEALREALAGDERVFLMGEDVGRYGGCYAVSKGLLEQFGEARVRDTPLSESAFVGAGIGAALGGMKPIVEIMTVNFSLLALDQILNTAATLLHMSGGQFNVPVVIRMATGGGRQLAAQHSHSLEGWYAHIPGLKVVTPATLEDARGMLRSALDDPDPVLIFENALLYNLEGELADDAGPVPLEGARVMRPGNDVTLVTYGGSLYKTLEAAEALEVDGIAAEVIDLRSLRPLDDDTVLGSVARTRRAVIVDEGWRSGSISAEIAARITERIFWELDAPVERVCSAEVPMPYAQHLEAAALPSVSEIVAAARRALGRNASES
jgi:pyruvate dehydrogenase E1 component beta subunit/2-oxoisovalerate dehydrogenase E1 component